MIASIETVRQDAECLFTHHQVQQALDSMAARISADLASSNALMLCVMNGGVITAGHLATRLNLLMEMDYLHATRYRNTTCGDELEWLHEPQTPLQARVILLVDDILDEGITLDAVANYCHKAGASRVLSAVLVKKNHQRNIGFAADYVGLEVDDRYVFGYGMDYKGYLRNAAGIYAVRQEGEHT
ncbi:MAG: hypoxanthine-guanine phosphoribosyltransferase [gamma proteobacterium symbiont of Bathyaustriella thionipta]|nr:hypoxanthine-guanine phosphoribosyltransferase [gamma proteobacterium symbiont of Bathyaustriella thionipta]